MIFKKSDNTKRYRGSGLLLSAGHRMRRMFIVVLFMWLLTAWALEWI